MIDWKCGEWHWCKVVNPEKDNYGVIVRVYRSWDGDWYYTKDCDDWYEEEYRADDIVITDVHDSKCEVKVMDDEYWNEFTNKTARDILVKLVENHTAERYEDFAIEAANFAQALTDKLRNRK